MNIKDIHSKFGTQRKCLDYMVKMRCGKSVHYTFCDSKKVKAIKIEAGRYSCRNCKKSFSVLVDTIFEDTRLDLPTWFLTIGLVLNAKSGISATDLQRNLGVTYKTIIQLCVPVLVCLCLKHN